MADPTRISQPSASGAIDLGDLINQFTELCDAAPPERDRWLDALEGRDPAAARMLRRMLEADASGEAQTLDTPLIDLDAELINGPATIDAMPSHAPGLGGRYEVLRALGFGANGDVYLARQRQPVERDVAIKVLRPSQVRPSTVERMAREAKALAALSHPNIAMVFEAGQTDDGRPFIATEFVAGEPIDAWCRTARASARARILTLALVCRAVEHMHQRGVIHRDLKPTNILVAGTPEDPRPKILDLGIARIIGDDGQAAPTLTQPGALLGSLGYIAPEQFKGAPADTRSDIFALGRVLERLLKDLADPWASRHARDLAAVVRMATESEPARRYASAGAFADDLEGLLHERGVAARPPSRREALWRLMRRHKITTALGVLAVASSLVAIATLSYSAQQLQRNNEFQKATIKDTFDGLVLYLGRYGGTHEQRVQLVSTMERQLDQLLSYSPNDPDLLILRARLLTERARLYIGLHQPDRAQPLSEAAVALMERLVDVRTSTEQDLAHKALTLIIRGDVHYERGQYPLARQVYERVLALQREAAQRFPESRKLKLSICWSYDRLTYPLWIDHDAAYQPTLLQRAHDRLDASQNLAHREPDDKDILYNLAMGQFRLGQNLIDADPARATGLLERACDGLEALVAREPQRSGFVINFAFASLRLALCYDNAGDTQSTIETLDRALTVLERCILGLDTNEVGITDMARRTFDEVIEWHASRGRPDLAAEAQRRLAVIEAHVQGL